MNALEAGLSCFGGFCVLADSFAFLAASLALRGKLRREKCNMLQKSLVGMAFKVNIGREKANLEEKNAAYCKNLL